MNKADRKELNDAIGLLQEAQAKVQEAKDIVERIGEGEQEKFDNMTEGLQAGERGQRMEEVANELADVANELDLDFDDWVGRIEAAME